MASEHKTERSIAFAETDMGGIAHFSNFFRYMEDTEHALFRSLGFSVVTRVDGQRYAWPRVHAECDYARPIAFEETLEVHLLVRQLRSRSIDYAFVFRKIGASSGEERVATGGLTAVCTQHAPDGGMKAVPIPEAIATRLEAAPASRLAEVGL